MDITRDPYVSEQTSNDNIIFSFRGTETSFLTVRVRKRNWKRKKKKKNQNEFKKILKQFSISARLITAMDFFFSPDFYFYLTATKKHEIK